MKRSSKRADTTGGKIRFAEIADSPLEAPAWLAQVSQGKATTVTSVYPQAVNTSEEEEEAEDEFEAPSQRVYVPHARPANDAEPQPAHSSRKEAPPPPAPVQPAPFRRSEIPRPPKAPDTLVDELIPRADEEAAGVLSEALSDLAAQRAQFLASAEDDIFQLVKLIAERVIAREVRSDPRVVTALVREGLAALSARDACTVRLGRFYASVIDEVRVAVAEVAMEVSVTIDPLLPLYGCVVESQWGRVDESVDARLRTLVDQLDAMRVRSGGE